MFVFCNVFVKNSKSIATRFLKFELGPSSVVTDFSCVQTNNRTFAIQVAKNIRTDSLQGECPAKKFQKRKENEKNTFFYLRSNKIKIEITNKNNNK